MMRLVLAVIVAAVIVGLVIQIIDGTRAIKEVSASEDQHRVDCESRGGVPVYVKYEGSLCFDPGAFR